VQQSAAFRGLRFGKDVFMTDPYRALIGFVAASVISVVLMAPVETRSSSIGVDQAHHGFGPPPTVPGGVTFQVPLPYARVFDTVVGALQRQHRGIDVADRQAGQIVSHVAISGCWRQTGTRIQVFLIKDSERVTTIKVQVTSALRRSQSPAAEPWGPPCLDLVQTARESALLRARI
jgi:hypothetical protein